MTKESIFDDLVYGSYWNALPYLKGLDSATRDITLTSELLKQLGNPYGRWPAVTVAGSKGKGSTAVLIAKLLNLAGERVGLITSPHLRRFNERIRVNGRCASDGELDDAAAAVAPFVRKIEEELEPMRYLGPGGIILALAAHVFAANNVTSIVVEAGRGGEFDEAKCIRANVSVFTPVMLEHADKLGNTVQEIAFTKARITTPGAPLVTSPQYPEVLEVFTEVAEELGSRLLRSDIEVKIKSKIKGWKSICDLELGGKRYHDIELSLAGSHQTENLATAFVGAAELLKSAGRQMTGISSDSLATLRWPGRAQILQDQPLVLLDGAINAASARYLCELARQHKPKSFSAVIAVPAPKDLAGVCEEVAKITDYAVLTEVETPSLHWYQNALTIARKFIGESEFIADYNQAIDRALERSGPGDCVLLIGTQSFVGVVLDRWNIETCVLW